MDSNTPFIGKILKSGQKKTESKENMSPNVGNQEHLQSYLLRAEETAKVPTILLCVVALC